MSEYVGLNSCAYKKEGWYIKRAPDKEGYYYALIWASLRDYRRGYKYDDTSGCRKKRCGLDCFEKKINFIKLLVQRSPLSAQAKRRVIRECDKVLKTKTMSATAKRKAKPYIVGKAIRI